MRATGWVLLLLLLVGGLLWLALGGQPDAPVPGDPSPDRKDAGEPLVLKTREGAAEALADARRDDSEPDMPEASAVVEGAAVRAGETRRLRIWK